MLFKPGKVIGTPGAIEAIGEAKETFPGLLRRHLKGDWGDVCPEDKALNDASVKDGSRVLSVYTLSTGVKMWIITEADRSVTTFLLPEEY